MARVGAHVFSTLRASGQLDATSTEAPAGLHALRALVERGEAREGALERSLAADRRDYAEASELARWAVIGRGVLERVALRDRAKHDGRERAKLERELGRRALDGPHAELRALVTEPLAAEVAAARDDLRAAVEERSKLLEPYGGQPLPSWLATALSEVRVFLGFVWELLSKKIFLRAPALAGLLVGWWIGRDFSDSPVVSWAHEHIGLDLRDASEKERHDTLAFWLPLLTAALCSYIGWAIASRVQRKYAAPPTDPK